MTITSSGFLVAADEAPFFIQLTTPGAITKEGSLMGTFNLIPQVPPLNAEVRSHDMRWFRPDVRAKPVGAKLLAYKAGWPQGIDLTAAGAIYNPALTVSASLGTSPTGTWLGFTRGKLSGPVDVRNFTIEGNKITKLPATDKSFTLTVTPSTGMMTGTFTPDWTQPNRVLPTFQGVLIQGGLLQGGHGYFMSNRLYDLDPESGRVMLTR